MGLLCRIANDTARNSPAAPQARRQTVEKGKEAKEESGEKLAVAKPCIFAQQSASHAANAAKKGWRAPFSFKITPRRPAGLVPRRVERSGSRRPPCAANGAAGPVRRQLGAKAAVT